MEFFFSSLSLLLLTFIAAQLTFLVYSQLEAFKSFKDIKQNEEELSSVNHPIAPSTPNPQDMITPSFADGQVPIEQFTPNPKKEVTLKFTEDSQTGDHGVKEVEENEER